VIMIYDSLFPGLPTEWIFLGQLQLQRKRITPSGDQVQFYARDPIAARKAQALLTDFARTLPPGARFIPAPGCMAGGLPVSVEHAKFGYARLDSETTKEMLCPRR
jgi:hypothetical protein